MKIILSQKEMCTAVEYWLNNRIMPKPGRLNVKVVKLSESRVNDQSTFDLELVDADDSDDNGE